MDNKKLITQLYFIYIRIINFIANICFPVSLKKIPLKLLNVSLNKNTAINGKIRLFGLKKVEIGANSCINFGCYLDNREEIIIGKNVSISHDVKIYTAGHDYNSSDFKFTKKKVVIDNYVVIFSNVLVMPGVKIGEGAVLLPGSVVCKNVDPYSVYAGVPAKKIAPRERVDYTLEYKYWFAN